MAKVQKLKPANRTQNRSESNERMTQPRFELGTFSELTVLD